MIEITGSAGVAWLDEHRIVVSRQVDPSDIVSPHHLGVVDIGKGTWEELPLASMDGCQRTEYLLPQRLGDGRIGAVRRCFPKDPGAGGDWPTWLIAVDPTSLAVDELTPNLSTGKVVRISSYAWAPEMKEAVVSKGSRVCQTLYRAGASGLSPIDLIVTVDDKSFNLKDVADGECSATGQADDPAIAPDGSSLVFTASTAAIDTSGPARLDAPSSLLIQPSAGGAQRPLVSAIDDAVGVSFSPDGQCIGMGADIDGLGDGTFLVEPVSGKIAKASELAIPASWSPGGDYLAGGLIDGTGSDAREWLVVVPASCAAVQ